MNMLWPAPLKAALETGLSLVYPDCCQLCEKARATCQEGYVCSGCWRGLKFIVRPFCERCGLPYQGELTARFECSNCREMEYHFTYARAAVAAEGIALEVIRRYKYLRALWFEPFLADLLIRQAEPVLRAEPWDFIVPVPLHPQKQREREFNQAERLARRLGAALQLPVREGILTREVPTFTQTKLDRSARAANVAKAFAPGKSVRLQGERIILIDDVLTTGATTSACAQILRTQGAAEVCVWTVARGL